MRSANTNEFRNENSTNTSVQKDRVLVIIFYFNFIAIAFQILYKLAIVLLPVSRELNHMAELQVASGCLVYFDWPHDVISIILYIKLTIIRKLLMIKLHLDPSTNNNEQRRQNMAFLLYGKM